jgi:GxxExxY protein
MEPATVLTENDLGRLCLDAAFKVHRSLGPGLLENAYEQCLVYELKQMGLEVQHQHPLPLVYEGIVIEIGYRADIIINQKVIIEVKAVEALTDVHMAQILTYLKLNKCKLGLLINFNVALLKDGIKRVINGSL